MKEFIIINIGQDAVIVGDALQEQLAIENGVNDFNLMNKEFEHHIKAFYYETQNNQYVPRTIFIDYENINLRKKLYARQNFSTLRLMMEKCDALSGFIVVHSSNIEQHFDNEDFCYYPQYNFLLQNDLLSYRNCQDLIDAYKYLNEKSELIFTIQSQEQRMNCQMASKLTGQLICNCLASINQPFKRMLDITQFNQHLIPDLDLKFLSCGYDQTYIGAYQQNFSGINYQNGNFIKSAIIVRGEPHHDQIKQIQELTKSLTIGILEKAYGGITQISNHQNNLEILEQGIEKISKIPKQFYNCEYQIDDSIRELIRKYKSI